MDVPSGIPVRTAPTDRTFAGTAAVQARVIGALVLRNMRTRFGRHHLAYLTAVIWPLGHMGVLLVVYGVLGRQASFGTDLVLWVVSGGLPFVLYMYSFRWVSGGLSDAKSLMSFPIVKPTDVLIARALLELLTGAVIAVVAISILIVGGWDLQISDPAAAITGLLATLFFGISLGTAAAPILRGFPPAAPAVHLLAILMWLLGGILFLPDSVPAPYHQYFALNPFVHAAEWFRTGFFYDYVSETLNKPYLIFVSVCLTVFGLALERLTRR